MTTTPDAPRLSPPPRPLNPRARRRSWHERPVRVWMILTVLVAAMTLYFVARDLSLALRERRLIQSGVQVQAVVEIIDSFKSPERPFTRDEARHVKVRYATPGSPELTTEFELLPKTGALIRVGDRITLRVDPDDPTNVTSQTEPRPWIAHLAVVILFAPVVAVLALITLWQRQRVLNVWRSGNQASATVVDSHRSGMAPRSRVVRFTLDEGEDRRVFSTFWPAGAGELAPGDAIDLIVPASNADRAIAAKLYAE